MENEFGCRLALGLSKSEESIEEALTLRRRLKDTNYSAFAKDYFNTLAKNVLYGLQQKHTTTISQTVFARAFWEKIVEESLDEPRKFIETIQTLTELVYDSSNYFNYYLILELLDLFENNRSGDIPELFVIKSRIYIILSKYSEGIKDYNQAKDYFEKAIAFDSQAHRILGNEWPIREHLFLVMELGPLCELFFLAGQNNLGIAAADYARKIYFSAPKTYVNDWIDNLRLKRRIFFINNFNDTINWLAKFKPGMTAELQEAINQLENLISQLRSPGFIWYKAHLIDSLGTSKMRIGIQNKDCSILYEAREDLSLGMQIMKDNCFNHNKIFQTHLDEVNDAIKLTCPDESVNAGL
ncbi:MAG: hypothetical protein IPK76_21950 [Lewinellaceae bacterium]|nr:hypothetical protein [Lewinellaceae bacterium]